MPLTLRYAAHSEIGLVRKNNQDSGYASPTLMVVADGMGGAAAGDLASTVVIRQLQQVDGSYSGEEMLEVFAGAIIKASDTIADLIESDPALEGMGSTVCGAFFDGSRLGIANIGDSRGYLFRDGDLVRLTRDHSWVQTLVDEGRITENEALVHPHRSLILRVVNGNPKHEPDLMLHDVQPGDRYLFCSDGLCGLVDDPVIASKLAITDRDEALAALTQTALEHGGLDNITIVVADVVSGEPEGQPLLLGAAAKLDLPLHAAPPSAPMPVDTTPRPAPRAVLSAGSEDRYSPVEKRRRGFLRFLLVTLVGLLVVGGLLFGGWFYLKHQFYIGMNTEKVAIYQGVPETLGGIALSSLVETTDIKLSDLPPVYNGKVRNNEIRPADLPTARGAVDELRVKAEECVLKRAERAAQTAAPEPGTDVPSTVSPAATPTASPSGDPEEC